MIRYFLRTARDVELLCEEKRAKVLRKTRVLSLSHAVLNSLTIQFLFNTLFIQFFIFIFVFNVILSCTCAVTV